MRAAAILVTLALTARAYGAGVPFPGGVADERGERAFVAGAGGGAESIALRDGATRWRAPAAGRPVALVGRRLVTWLAGRWRNQVRFAFVDADSGRVLQTLPAVMLPSWVAVAPAFAHTFACQAVVEGEHVRVTWHATASWSQGMHPQEGQEAAARRDGTGALDVDVSKGHVVVLATPPATSPRVAGTTVDGRHLIERDGASWRIVEAGSHKQIALLPLAEGFREPTVVGARLYVVRNTTGLESIDLTDGRVCWHRALPRSTPIPAPQ